ncbi:hypothetical protein JQ616_21835 [Bradyrhizobium tropiciagri]|uniref:hypothetical protein n=1 Tax=Bradyrhizobium tropiciagri TaxID=312253 RepID=UPI001BABAD06|nr:hypothetical protein [Bradyrhizobium tropiciagri]MBR0897602.1 hypothetical protein [Bradyrhizobium tropiciagri]
MAVIQPVGEPTSELEAQLLRELKSLDRRIHELQSERATVERLIISARRSNPALAKLDVTRKNSIKRVLIESVVLENLKSAPEGRKTYELLAEMKLVDPKLKSNTFRSTLHRMKEKGVILNPKGGLWQVPAPLAV